MPASIFAGSKVKTLKSTLSLNGGADVISSTVNPTSVATDGLPGSLLLNTSSGKIYKKLDSGSTTNWQEITSGSSAEEIINYINNPDAEVDTTGWSTYADAAGSAPVDGTGGTANITWSRSTTSPLRGVADFNLVKDAVNRQGQGVSYDFTIDSADQAKILTISADYEVLSGTFATGDLAVYVIQDPAGTPVVLQPAGYQVTAGTNGNKLRLAATFQTASNVTSYRLCIHVASVSALAYTLAFDSVAVSPQQVVYGAPITDWQAYTPTTQGFGTISGLTAFYARVGDSLRIRGFFTAGTPTATQARVSLPSGLSIDSAKIGATIKIVGVAATGYNSATFFGVTSVADPAVAGSIVFSRQASTAGSTTTANGDSIIGTGNTFSFDAIVPILGWSSSVVVSSSTDTRVVAASVGAGAGVIANNTTVTVPFGSAVVDTHGGVGTNQYTIPVPGYYRLVAQARTSFPTANVTFNHQLSIHKNGSAIATDFAQGDGLNNANLNWLITSVNQVVSCNAGDVINVRFNTNYTGNSNTSLQFFSIERLSGPSQIAASESVVARYSTAAGQAITGGAVTLVNFGTAEYDSHGSVTTGASWKFTAPISGKYRVSGCVASVGFTPTAANRWTMQLYKNGASSQRLGIRRFDATLVTNADVIGSGTVNLLAGDYIDIRIDNSTAGASLAADAATNWITVERIGN